MQGVDDSEMNETITTVAADSVLRLNLGWLDYVLVAIYFVFVLGIGFIARSQISTSLDFFLSGRRLPAWVTGLAFISANLGAIEIMGMAANGAEVDCRPCTTTGSAPSPPCSSSAW
jgi:solute:Na+ symporter, SSS family